MVLPARRPERLCAEAVDERAAYRAKTDATLRVQLVLPELSGGVEAARIRSGGILIQGTDQIEEHHGSGGFVPVMICAGASNTARPSALT